MEAFRCLQKERGPVKFNRDPQMHTHTHIHTSSQTHKCITCFVPHTHSGTHYIITLHSFVSPFAPHSIPASSFFLFQVFTAHLIPELFQRLIVSDAYNFTHPPHPSPSSYPHPLFLSFLHFTFNYQTATTRHVEGRIKHMQAGKHTRGLAYNARRASSIYACLI